MTVEPTRSSTTSAFVDSFVDPWPRQPCSPLPHVIKVPCSVRTTVKSVKWSPQQTYGKNKDYFYIGINFRGYELSRRANSENFRVLTFVILISQLFPTLIYPIFPDFSPHVGDCWEMSVTLASGGAPQFSVKKVNKQDFLQVFQGSGIGKICHNFTWEML